jgi:hypothetical protein
MQLRLIVLFVLICSGIGANPAIAQDVQVESGLLAGLLFHTTDDGRLEPAQFLQQSENPRLVAIALDISLGLFGMHRLYLGTDVKVPIGYTLTFGGGGVLWLADLVMLIATRDITPYMNNPHFFMWVPPANAKP